jgi:hypothetical protein
MANKGSRNENKMNKYIWGRGCNNLHERKKNVPYHLQGNTMIYVVSFIGHNKEYFGWKLGAPHQHVKNVPNDINKFTLLLFHKFVMISSIVPYDVPIILCSYIPNDVPKVPNDFTHFLFIQNFHTFSSIIIFTSFFIKYCTFVWKSEMRTSKRKEP